MWAKLFTFALGWRRAEQKVMSDHAYVELHQHRVNRSVPPQFARPVRQEHVLSARDSRHENANPKVAPSSSREAGSLQGVSRFSQPPPTRQGHYPPGSIPPKVEMPRKLLRSRLPSPRAAVVPARKPRELRKLLFPPEEASEGFYVENGATRSSWGYSPSASVTGSPRSRLSGSGAWGVATDRASTAPPSPRIVSLAQNSPRSPPKELPRRPGVIRWSCLKGTYEYEEADGTVVDERNLVIGVDARYLPPYAAPDVIPRPQKSRPTLPLVAIAVMEADKRKERSRNGGRSAAFVKAM